MQNADTKAPVVTETGQEKMKSSIKTLPPLQFKTQLEANANAQLIDVRTKKEYDAGHLESSNNIDFFGDNFASDLKATIDVKQAVFVYCKAGGRSAKAAKILKELGCQEIYDLAGGYTAWSRAAVNTLPDTLKATTH